MSLSEKLPQALWVRMHLLLTPRTHGGGVSFKVANWGGGGKEGYKCIIKILATGKAVEQQQQNTVAL